MTRVLVQLYPDGAQVGDNVKDGLCRQGFRRLFGRYGVRGLHGNFFYCRSLGLLLPVLAAGYHSQHQHDIQILLHILDVSFGKIN